MLDLIIENKEILKLFYTFVIAFVCAVIVVKTDRLYRLSLHNGIRYVRNAFLFYGIGFVIRSFLGFPYLFGVSHTIINILFEVFLIVSGFFLLYSLLWKKLETEKGYSSSLLNPWAIIFYIMALIIALWDNLWKIYYFMFFSQIALFIFTTIISFVNYRKDKGKHKFLKLYFIAMFLSLIGWILNAIAALFFEWNPSILINTYVINIIIFLLFLYGVIKVTKK